MATSGKTSALSIRPIAVGDHAQWRPLWEGYNAFYGRQGETALAEHITQATWERFFDPAEPVHALVATEGPTVVALAHYFVHRRTTRLHDMCYLQDLFTAPGHRGRRIGQQLIEAVYAAARAAGSSRVYWQTQAGNTAGRALYDKVAGHAGFSVYARELQCGVGAATTTCSPGFSGNASHCRPWVVAAQHAGTRALLGTMRPPSLMEHGHGVVVAACRGVA